MPIRISPKFCARRWSQIQKLSYEVPNPSAKLGLNEPWPECQPELFQNDAAAAAAGGGGGDAGTTHPSWQVPESITHRDQISRSGIPHSDIYIYIYIYIAWYAFPLLPVSTLPGILSGSSVVSILPGMLSG